MERVTTPSARRWWDTPARLGSAAFAWTLAHRESHSVSDRTARVDAENLAVVTERRLRCAPVRDAVFSGDGRTLITAGSDRAIIWNVADGHRVIALESAVSRAALSVDAAIAITASNDELGIVKIWDKGVAAGLECLRERRDCGLFGAKCQWRSHRRIQSRAGLARR